MALSTHSAPVHQGQRYAQRSATAKPAMARSSSLRRPAFGTLPASRTIGRGLPSAPALRPSARAAAAPSTSTPLQQLGTMAVSLADKRVPVVVLGAQGASAIKLTKALVEAGFSVTAGIDYPEEAKATLAFAKKFELLPRAQLAAIKLAESGDRLPRGARVVVFEGDEVGGSKVEARDVDAAAARVAASGAAQLILISTSSSAPSGGLFNFGANPKAPNKSLTRAEQLAAASGLPVTVLRVAVSASAPAEGGVKLAAGPGALAPAAAPISGATLAALLGGVLSSPAAPAGVPVVLEAAGVPAADAAPLAQALREAVDEAVAKAPAPATPPPAPKPALPSLPSLGTVTIRRAGRAAAAEEEEEEAPAPKARSVSPFAAFSKPRSPPAAVKATSPEPEAPPKPAPGGWLAGLLSPGGTLVVSNSKKAPTPAPPKAGRGGTTSIKAGGGTTKVKAGSAKLNPFSTVKRTPSPEPDVEAPPKAPSIFSFFAVNPTQRAAPKSPAPAPVGRAKPTPATRQVPRASAAPRGRTPDAGPPEPKAKSGGLFGGLFGGAKAVDAEEATPPRRGVAPKPSPPARKPTPPPAKPAAQRGTASIKRSSPPPKPAARSPPAKPTPSPPPSSGAPKGTYRPVSGYVVAPRKQK